MKKELAIELLANCLNLEVKNEFYFNDCSFLINLNNGWIKVLIR